VLDAAGAAEVVDRAVVDSVVVAVVGGLAEVVGVAVDEDPQAASPAASAIAVTAVTILPSK
jgi:hypothetical protein